MKKIVILLFVAASVFSVQQVSAWAGLGHMASAQIAEKHLTPEAKAVTQKYLNASLPSVAVWMDRTASWNKKRKIYEIEKYLHMLQEILDSRVLMYENSNLMIESKKNIMQERLDNLKAGLPLKIIKQYTKHQQDIRWATLICDLVICRQKL